MSQKRIQDIFTRLALAPPSQPSPPPMQLGSRASSGTDSLLKASATSLSHETPSNFTPIPLSPSKNPSSPLSPSYDCIDLTPISPPVDINTITHLHYGEAEKHKWRQHADLTTDWQDIFVPITTRTHGRKGVLSPVLEIKEPRPQTPPSSPRPLTPAERMARDRSELLRIANRNHFWWPGSSGGARSDFGEDGEDGEAAAVYARLRWVQWIGKEVREKGPGGNMEECHDFNSWKMSVMDDLRWIMDHAGDDASGAWERDRAAKVFAGVARGLRALEETGTGVIMESDFVCVLNEQLATAGAFLDTNKFKVLTRVGDGNSINGAW